MRPLRGDMTVRGEIMGHKGITKKFKEMGKALNSDPAR